MPHAFASVLTSTTQIVAFANAGAGGILVPVEGFAARSRRHFRCPKLHGSQRKRTRLNPTVHLRMNTMIHETDLPALRACLRELAAIPFDRIVCFDLTVAIVAAEFHLKERIVYQPGTLATNAYDPLFYASLGIRGLTLSPDIQQSELLEIAQAARDIECSLVSHGYLPMLISKRHLLSAYFVEKKQTLKANQDFAYQISEETRPGTLFPILEDEFGTHLFRPAALASFEEIAALREWIGGFLYRNHLPSGRRSSFGD
ncbi:MAG: U32 family peptidase [Bacillus subtilis]|nr:U32 family peptidase [Bacillus subtilis]